MFGRIVEITQSTPGGTWPYDRAGWCPGTKVDEYIFELTNLVNPGQTITIDYEIQKMTDQKKPKGFTE